MTGLRHNLLSISQICDKGHDVIFNTYGCEIRKSSNGKLVAAGTRTSGNLYMLTDEMEDCKSVSTPMVIGCKLSKDDESPLVDQTMYRSMIGSLLYLTASRPDILGTMEHGLWYLRGSDFTLTAYSGADWAGSIDDRKSTSGGAFYLGNSLVVWHSKKQDLVSLSIAEAEYIVATSCCT
ncbi:uncharacterized mitochondrial protein AtMg00810-like [Telopea speciosissima]|uniref:uncharacterized mitochondrial protein AtMg00810-like n=1 Tax=Telopea speciosissima TaxID=54955 RepID=UPI001CC3EFD4|nr:uncharacterized mitochondrial protein AtMg00810-like [Telopea speciosissima]